MSTTAAVFRQLGMKMHQVLFDYRRRTNPREARIIVQNGDARMSPSPVLMLWRL